MIRASEIVRRKGPQLGFDRDVPRHWLGGDPFRTRFFDALSLTFPGGERYFIRCVRAFRDQVRDPELAEQVKDFDYQEGQHSLIHAQFNDRLREQGIDVDNVLSVVDDWLERDRRRFSSTFNLGKTAGAEHMTAIMAHGFFETGFFDDADGRMRALYAWHAVEEIEHKAVAFDVFERVAGGGYLLRVVSMLYTSGIFTLYTLVVLRQMLRADGSNTWTNWWRGLWWLYGPRGLYAQVLPHYLAYFSPGFHPWKHGDLDAYRRWRAAYDSTNGDAIAAGDALARSGAQRSSRG